MQRVTFPSDKERIKQICKDFTKDHFPAFPEVIYEPFSYKRVLNDIEVMTSNKCIKQRHNFLLDDVVNTQFIV